MVPSVASPIASLVARHWWVLLLRGVFAIVFGLVALAWPHLTLAYLIFLYAFYCLAEGVVAIIGGIRGKLWQSVLLGVVSILAGLAAMMYPGLTALFLLFLIGGWSIMRGIFEIVTAIHLRKVISNEWLLVFAGLCSIAFGVMVILFPGTGALSLVWLIGIYSLIFGVVLVALSFRVRRVATA